MGAADQLKFLAGSEGGLLRDPVDDSAPSSTAEHQRVRALQHLDSLQVIEIAVVLDVIANAIDEKAGGGVVTPNHNFIAIVLSLMGGDAGDVPDDVTNTEHRLILNLLVCDDRQCLRNITQEGLCFRGCADRGNLTTCFGHRDHLPDWGNAQRESEALRTCSCGYIQFFSQVGKSLRRDADRVMTWHER